METSACRRDSVRSEIEKDRAETMRGSLGCLLLSQISYELDQHHRAEVSGDNGNYHNRDGSSDQIKRIKSA